MEEPSTREAPDFDAPLTERSHIVRRNFITASQSPPRDTPSPAGSSNRSWSGPSSPRSVNAARTGEAHAPKSNYYLVSVRVVEITSLVLPTQAEGGDAPLTVRIVLTMAGYVYASKPIVIEKQASVQVPDDTFSFEITSTLDRPILSVRVIDQSGCDTLQMKRFRGYNYETTDMKSGTLDLSTSLESGAQVRLRCKLSCDAESGSIPEVLLDVHAVCRPTDFVFSYLEDVPVFKKSGYTISHLGIATFPQPFRKRGLPPGCTLRSLEVGQGEWAGQ